MSNLSAMVRSIGLVVLLGIPSTALSASEPFLGEIMMTGANFCPRGWANLDGQLLPISQNQALYSLLGTAYGGDGRMTFGLPDLRGRVPLHVGQGPGLTDRRQGSKGGEENHALNIAEMPPHHHALNASKETANQLTPTGNLLANQSGRKMIYAPPAANAVTPMHANAIGITGSGQTHNNMQPFLGIRFCMALQGVYPSRQ